MPIEPDVLVKLRHEANTMERTFICQECKKKHWISTDDLLNLHIADNAANPYGDAELSDTLASIEFCKGCIR